jgi:uncharacterized phiE125 gp8 family phage protein
MLRLSVLPVITPITLDEAKTHLRIIDDTALDSYVSSLIEAATGYLDGPGGILGRALCPQTYILHLDKFPSCGEALEIPMPPLKEIESVDYSFDGAEESLIENVDFKIKNDGRNHAKIVPIAKSWPNADNVEIQFIAGYSQVPAPIKQAMLLMIGFWFENRETVNVGNIVSELPFTLAALINPYRIRVM